MIVLTRGRQSGKTHQAVQWVKRGREIKGYPGWSRILLVHSLTEAQRLRSPGRPGRLDYHQVFSYDEFINGRFLAAELQIAVDNVDLLLTKYLGIMPTLITVNGGNLENHND